MKRLLTFLTFLCCFSLSAQIQTATFSVDPSTFEATEEITVTVTNIDPSIWGVSDIYLWAWYFDLDDNIAGDSPTNGSWTNSDESQKFTDNGDGSYSYTFTPSALYGTSDIGRIGMLAKAKDASDMGNGERKTQDYLVEVGGFELVVTQPSTEISIVPSGTNLSIVANTSELANFELFANGNSIDSETNSSNYSTNYTITEDTYFELVATEVSSGNQRSKTFNVILTPTTQNLPVPAGMEDGINWDPNSPDTATFVLFAPNKDFVHLIGNFSTNEWQLSNAYLLNKDTSTNRFWITFNNLDELPEDFLFQYVIDAEIRVADPYSTYILDEFNDAFIEADTFEYIPEYPSGKTNHAITWFETNPEPYNWQVTDFERPKQSELIVYELLIRDFDEDHSFESLIDRLEYLENLGVNAIELMPVSEFDGNISWGYNPSFHMALDKYYGNKNSFKAFVDACHERGIAVILDVVYNHATGQNPYFRMYNDCNGCYGGQATAENPIFNVEDPNSTFSFFNDIDHESLETQYYVDRLNKFWLEEYNIDGYRFDFTKGFTNTPGDGGAYDASRIALLQRMYDEIRSVDPSAYIILEHFAPNEEETELIEYEATSNPDEPGMMVWSNHNFHYNEATMGYNSNSDFSWINYQNRGWNTPSNIAYMESHDEERLMYKNLEFGNSDGSYDVTNLATALDRIEMAGAFFFSIPGPKMIWQFGELGYDFSINYCEDGSINNACRVDPKPLPWPLGYNTQQDRNDLYHAFRTFIGLRRENPIFHTTSFNLDVGNANGVKKIHLEDPNATADAIRFVTILGNFSVFNQTFNPEFQEAGSWYSMLDGSEITVSNTNEPITLAPGEYYIYANEIPTLNLQETEKPIISLYPNPSSDILFFSDDITQVELYDMQGKKILMFSNYKANTPLEISTLPAGLYFAKAMTNNNIHTFKFIKT